MMEGRMSAFAKTESTESIPYRIVTLEYPWVSCQVVTVKTEFKHLNKFEFNTLFPDAFTNMRSIAIPRLFRTLKFHTEKKGSTTSTGRQTLDDVVSGSTGIAFVLGVLSDTNLDNRPWKWTEIGK